MEIETLMGFSQIIASAEKSDRHREYAGQITLECRRMTDLINQLLDLAKIEAGKMDLEILDFDLRTTLEDMGDALAIKAQEKGLEYLTLIDSGVPSLLQGDPGRLRQVLTNLIGNAVKFTTAGEISVQTTVEKETKTDVTLRFEVKDTGTGILPDKVDKLFDAFTQADGSTSRKFGGTGLGLTISKKLVEMMGGTIGAESEEGKGSTFWFTTVFQKQLITRAEIDLKKEAEITLQGKHILVVDDNETNRLLMEKILLSWNCRHEEAPDGKTALCKLKTGANSNDPFRIAILDMQMPGMNGETLGRKIKERPALKDIMLVMMTSMGQRGDAARLKKIGFSAYLSKPVKQSQLYDCLVSVLRDKEIEKKRSPEKIITRHSLAERKKQKIRILLAEDNVTNQFVALKILEKLGYRADAVANGLEAVNAVKILPYDLILMDVQMPEMDGLEATRQIRKLKKTNPKISIIAMTAHAMKGDREKCLQAGMDDYVTKPINPQALIEAIDRNLSHYREDKQEVRREKEDECRSEKIFDKTALLERLGDDEEIYTEVIQLFLADIPLEIEMLQEAFANNDTTLAKRQAHTIKGAAGNVGALALQEAAQQMENADKKSGKSQIDEILNKINEEFGKVRKILDTAVK